MQDGHAQQIFLFAEAHQVKAEHVEQLAEEASLGVLGEGRQLAPFQHSHVFQDYTKETPCVEGMGREERGEGIIRNTAPFLMTQHHHYDIIVIRYFIL